MKKVLVALVAVFAFGTMAIAQETVEMNLDNNAFATVSEADYSSAVADLEDFDLSDLKDFSFATENEDFSALVLDKAQGNDRVIGAMNFISPAGSSSVCASCFSHASASACASFRMDSMLSSVS